MSNKVNKFYETWINYKNGNDVKDYESNDLKRALTFVLLLIADKVSIDESTITDFINKYCPDKERGYKAAINKVKNEAAIKEALKNAEIEALRAEIEALKNAKAAKKTAKV